jgi:integrase
LFDLSAFQLATGLRIGEALAVLRRDVDLDLVRELARVSCFMT